MKFFSCLTSLAALSFAPLLSAASSDATQFWPQWRGPLATGAAPLADPPTTWSETEHIKWKVKIPGAGDSTPIVWAGKVFLLTAVPKGKQTQASISERSQPAGGGDVAPERPTPD